MLFWGIPITMVVPFRAPEDSRRRLKPSSRPLPVNSRGPRSLHAKLRKLARLAPTKLVSVEYLVDLLLKSAGMIMVATLASCADSPAPAPSPIPPQAPTTATLRGTVSSRSGASAGATVEILDGADRTKTTTSASDGSYAIPGVTHGTFSIRASRAGYVSDERRVTMNADGVQDFRLTQASIVPSGAAPTITLLPAQHQYQFSGSLQNVGDACASNLRGTFELAIDNGPRISMPLVLASPSVAPGATVGFTACCVDDRYAGTTGIATPTLVYDSVVCG